MRYINISWICDDVADCLNSADEETSLCNKTGAFSLSGNISQNIRSLYTCTEDEFECANGQCIPSNLVCDETSHCLDGTDEGDNCSKSLILCLLCQACIEFANYYYISVYYKCVCNQPLHVNKMAAVHKLAFRGQKDLLAYANLATYLMTTDESVRMSTSVQ